ncbi:hypothetical protein [uncultured Lutibacter sp.]|uniref:hypothetical protein n=1 Tax=uncultured Lutibacter sp. TaxID=437739 RepID=UPI00260A40E5|nr:hypothetical protein [uncultured Lutibacter sp.]
MKTKLFLIATLLISTITFSQTSKKGYDYYQASSDTKMNKAELVDSIAKDAGNSKTSRVGRNPQTGATIKAKPRHNWVNSNSRSRVSNQKIEQTTNYKTRQRPIDGKNKFGQSDDLILRKRPGRSQGDPVPGIGITTEQGKVGTQGKQIKIKPKSTNATDYNSSRSNRTTNN